MGLLLIRTILQLSSERQRSETRVRDSSPPDAVFVIDFSFLSFDQAQGVSLKLEFVLEGRSRREKGGHEVGDGSDCDEQ